MDFGLETSQSSANQLDCEGTSTPPCDETERPKPELTTAVDAVEAALAAALMSATAAQRWDIIAQLARELDARRLARAENVIVLAVERRRDGDAR